MWRKTNRFFQIFVYEKNIILKKINNNKIELCNSYTFEKINDLYQYINKKCKIPVEIIIHNNDTVVRNLLLCNMKNAEIKNILQNNLISSDIEFNTSFYIKKDTSLIVCDTLINEPVANFFNWLILSNVLSVSFLCWPLWIVNSYFSIFSHDVTQFKFSLLMTKSKDFVEIIVVNDHLDIICYRNFSALNFKENEEIAATMRYVSGLYKIDYNDIAMYTMDESSLETFVTPSSTRMSFISKVLPDYSTNFDEYKNVIKAALKAMCFMCVLLVFWQVMDISSTKSKITTASQTEQSFPAYVLEEKENWENIDDSIIENTDFYKLVEDILNNTENSHMKELDLCIDGESLNVNIQLLDNNVSAPYSKKITSANYNFNISVSNDGIICNGKHC